MTAARELGHRHGSGREDLTDLVPARQVGREVVGIFLAETTEIDDARNTRPFCGHACVLGAQTVGLFEIVGMPHGVNQVVHRFDPAQRRIERWRVENVGSDDVDIAAPFDEVEPVRVACETAHVVPGGEEFGHQAPAHVPRRSDDCDLHDPTPTMVAILSSRRSATRQTKT